jgi:large subunit ribosomal protein L43
VGSSVHNGHVAFVPQIRKLVFEFCEAWPTSALLREVLGLHAETLVRENPHVEIVVKERMYRESVVREFYCGCLFFFFLLVS